MVRGETGAPLIGLYRAGSHEAVTIPDCRRGSPDAQSIHPVQMSGGEDKVLKMDIDFLLGWVKGFVYHKRCFPSTCILP